MVVNHLVRSFDVGQYILRQSPGYQNLHFKLPLKEVDNRPVILKIRRFAGLLVFVKKLSQKMDFGSPQKARGIYDKIKAGVNIKPE